MGTLVQVQMLNRYALRVTYQKIERKWSIMSWNIVLIVDDDERNVVKLC